MDENRKEILTKQSSDVLENLKILVKTNLVDYVDKIGVFNSKRPGKILHQVGAMPKHHHLNNSRGPCQSKGTFGYIME